MTRIKNKKYLKRPLKLRGLFISKITSNIYIFGIKDFTSIKKSILIIFISICFLSKAQDTLFFKNSNKLVVKVLEITPSNIMYKRFDNIDGPLYSSLKSEISSIIYSTGLKETIEAAQTATIHSIPSSTSEETSNDGVSYYEKGKTDAKIYYKHNGGSIGTAICVFPLTPFLGWIPPLIINSFKPRERHLNMPDKNISRNKLYQAGYKEQAYKIKRKKNWKAYGLSSLIYTGVYVILNIK